MRQTSLEAYDSIKPRAGTIREDIYKMIEVNGGATADEIEAEGGYLPQTATARINELAKAGRIKDSGERRLTRSGRKAIVWTTSS